MANDTDQSLCSHKHEALLEEVVKNGYPFYIGNIVVNSVTCLPVAFVNGVVIASILRTPALHTPSNIFICSLALTDFITGSLAQPLHVISRVAEVKNYFEIFCSTWIISRVLANWVAKVCLLTLTAISIDRVLAMHLGLRYKTIMTRKLVIVIAAVLWLLGGFLAATRLFLYNVPVFLGIGAVVYIACLLIMISSYWKTYHALKRHHLQMQNQFYGQGSRDLSNVLRYKRSLNTMLYIVGLVLLCYLPYIILALIVVCGGRTVVERSAWTVVDTIMFFNSLLNPLLYYWRIGEIRHAVLQLTTNRFRKVSAFSHAKSARFELQVPTKVQIFSSKVDPACAKTSSSNLELRLESLYTDEK